MAIRVNNVFKAIHGDLSIQAKLLYIYLMTHPQLETVGVVQINPEISCLEIGVDLDQFRTSTQLLVDKKLISVKKVGDKVYFLVVYHYDTFPKGGATIKRAEKGLLKYPSDIQEWVNSLINIRGKEVVFIEPTPREVEDFAMSAGYVVDGELIVSYYRERAEFFRKKDWVDGKGKAVIDWKKKIRAVWCRDSNKLKRQDDAPVGYEYFHIKYGDRIVYPDYWRAGYPQSREGLVITEELLQGYERQRNRI